jgi:hypothetical protein
LSPLDEAPDGKQLFRAYACKGRRGTNAALDLTMSEPSQSELATVLASYGNAVFACTLLESGLRLLLGVAADARKRQGVPDPLDTAKSGKAKMLGELFPLALQYEAFTEQERKQVWDAIRLRNLLIHNYWTAQSTLAFRTEQGREWLVEDLEIKRVQIRDADRIISHYVDSYLAEHGVSIESLSAPAFAEYEPNAGPPNSVLQ